MCTYHWHPLFMCDTNPRSYQLIDNGIDNIPDQSLFSNITDDCVRDVQREFGTPIYLYSELELQRYARNAMAFPNAFGLTVRYAMKASPNGSIIRTLAREGLHIDASSGYEAERALLVGIPAESIQITAQQFPENIEELTSKGVLFNASSLLQLESYGQRCYGGSVSIRLNPGMGSGHNNRTNVGGIASSFGIWHEYINDAIAIAEKYKLTINRVHTHIGSGSDPMVWQRVALMSLEMCAKLPDATVLNLGGGFKIGRIAGEETTNLTKIGEPVKQAFGNFAHRYGRKLHLEIEPGCYLVGNAGVIICSVTDMSCITSNVRYA